MKTKITTIEDLITSLIDQRSCLIATINVCVNDEKEVSGSIKALKITDESIKEIAKLLPNDSEKRLDLLPNKSYFTKKDRQVEREAKELLK